MLFAVVDFVSSDLEDVAQKCSLSYKVEGTTPHSWYISQGAQSCLAHGQGWACLGALLQQLLAVDQSHFQTSLCPQALVAVRRVLLAQFSAFPANGADLYEELKSSTAILPTGSPRWGPHPPTSSAWGWVCCTRLWLPAQALNFILQTIPMHLRAFWEGDFGGKYLGAAAS